MPLSAFESTPLEVLEEIALWIVRSSFLGPPSGIIALLLVSGSVWKSLALRFNTHLLSGDTHQLELSTELVKRFQALKRLKEHSHCYERNVQLLRNDLWVAYSMFLESDINNHRQLIEFANVDQFVFKYVSMGGLLHHGANENGGWTVDSEENALALWVFWFTDKQRVLSENPAERQNILRALTSLFFGSFKYASAHAPITSFRIPPATPPPFIAPSRALTLAATPVSPRCPIASHFGLELSLARPLMLPPALLSYVVRLEVSISEIDWQPPVHIPATRADAIAVGWDGPTREDHMIQHIPTTRFVEWGDEALYHMSERHDVDWMRLRSCYEPWDYHHKKGRISTLGAFHGKWVGRWFGIPLDQFNDLLSSQQSDMPISTYIPLVFPVPMQFCLREHYQCDPRGVVGFNDISSDGIGKGVFHAWLPERTKWAQINDELEIYVSGVKKPYKYRTYSASAAAAAQAALDNELARDHEHPHEDILDIIVTAETDEAFAEAWGHKRYYGRVRSWDGLIVLVREATETEGQWIFRGYLHGNQNLVGLWRVTGTPVDVPAWEGVWSMSKIDDE